MVLKKKDGKDIEVQDGWMGRVIPFELVQREMLFDKKDELLQMESRLSEIQSAYEEFLESLRRFLERRTKTRGRKVGKCRNFE